MHLPANTASEQNAELTRAMHPLTANLWADFGDFSKVEQAAPGTGLLDRSWTGLRLSLARGREAPRHQGGRDVYMILFEGELDGGPRRDGIVYSAEASIDAYWSITASVWSGRRSFYRIFYRIDPDGPRQTNTNRDIEVAKAQPRGTNRHGRERAVISL